MNNMVIRHRAQNSTIIFAKRNHHEFPITINKLREHMENLSKSHLADKLMQFSMTVRATQSYKEKCQGELSDLLHQIGMLTIFFTLTIADFYWPNIHALVLGKPHTEPHEAQLWKKQNFIDYPHITTHYMHLRKSMCRKEVLGKG